jgi:beta-lactam-binding protein with PASTA domain
VPKLTGKKLKGARKALTGANCKLGKVTRAFPKASKVTRQSPKTGSTKPAGSSVNVSLG